MSNRTSEQKRPKGFERTIEDVLAEQRGDPPPQYPPTSNPQFDAGFHAGLLHYSKIADDLRARLLRACAYLRQVGDDYPGSSCQEWCRQRADECAADAADPGPLGVCEHGRWNGPSMRCPQCAADVAGDATE